eukprot:2833563-Prymnesium_polylepis.1
MAGQNGGAILALNSRMAVMADSLIVNCSTEQSGGALATAGGESLVARSKIVKCAAKCAGGAIGVGSGGKVRVINGTQIIDASSSLDG